MASPPYNFYYPHFPPPSPPATIPPSHSIPPPSPHTVAPPPPHIIPPAAKPPSHPIPPPPHHTVSPPPPHIIPPAANPPRHSIPPPRPSPPGNNSTVIVIVFVSFGGLLFLAFLAFALCCFVKRKKKKTDQKTDMTRADGHFKMQERVVKRPDGSEVVDLFIEDDAHFGEKKKEKEEEEKLREVGVGENIHNTLEEGVSTSGSSHHQLEHKPHLEHDSRSKINFF